MTEAIPAVTPGLVPHAATDAEMAGWADRIEGGIADTKENLGLLAQQINDRVREALQLVPQEARAEILGGCSEGAFAAVYRLGQLSFASLIVGQCFNGRADDDIVDHLQCASLRPLVLRLRESDKSSQELSADLGEAVEDVRRKLGVLSGKGLVDWRGSSSGLQYFLTPCARAVLDAETPQRI